ncbi:MAG: hypothetical protein EG826_14400 [Deltaproteobacteria bacterium]|nr:hypothetical protein [Deltaproteobacteria bacterium]
MNVKGTFYVLTKTAMTAAFGEERWTSFMTKLAEKDAYFKKVIMSITLSPVEKLIIFFDEMCAEFFNNDRMSYLMFGKIGAKYALSPEGPYKAFMLTKDIKQFVEVYMPKLWTAFFDGGKVVTKLENNVVHLKVTGINIKNVYFEQLVMGYNQQALKVFGKKTAAKKIRSIASGDADIYCQFELLEA